MNLYVGLYSSGKFMGGPLSEVSVVTKPLEEGLSPEVIMSNVTEEVINILSANRDQLADQTVVDTISSNGLIRNLDIQEVNRFLADSNLTLLVGQYHVPEMGLDPTKQDIGDLASRVILVTPASFGLPAIDIYNINDPDDFRLEDVVSQWVSVYNVGRVTPTNDLNNIIFSLNNLTEMGLPVTEAHRNLLLRELDRYKVELIIVN